jgi:hypothetical protein
VIVSIQQYPDRQCTKCKEIKNTRYGFYKRKSGDYDGYCRECKNEQSRELHRKRYWEDEVYREKQRAKSRKAKVAGYVN